MKDIILNLLKEYKRRTISLIEIEKALSGNADYVDFANVINELMAKGILFPVKKHGTNNKKIPLPNTYRIDKSYFRKDLVDEITSYQFKTNEHINLQAYFSLSEKRWMKDLPYIKKIESYINREGLPQYEVTAPERSYEITGDEKWIDEKGGRDLLERIELLEKMRINPMPDPLMFAINTNIINDSREHLHLIVENKATFYALLDDIKNTVFTSLVYGAGWKVLGGITVFERQLGLKKKHNTFFYFGDLDFEGISIWYKLNKKKKSKLAVEFYEFLLDKPCSYGKENQEPNREAIDSFLLNFNNYNKEKIVNTLENNGYYPQEGLDKRELQAIWRSIK